MSTSLIRPATERDLPRLVEVEEAAGQRFHSVDMPAIADDVPDVDELREAWSLGRLWVVEVGTETGAEAGTEVAGYVTADLVDGNAYVAQVSVTPEHAGRGLGRVLLEHVEAWGRAAGCPATTLTTFRDVPWNAPYYRRLGYEVIAGDRVGPELARVMELQAALPQLGTAPRCAMLKPNDGPGGARP